MPRANLVLVMFMLLSSSVAAQPSPGTARSAPVTEQAEASPPQKKTKQKGRFKANWKLPYPNPYRAAIYSLVLPSAGQIYNKRYWKAPIVWGAFAGLIYSVDYNKGQRDRFHTAYELRLSGEDDEFTGIIGTPSALKRYRDSFDKNLQTTYVGFVAMYALQALDAYVDAHLKSFDISDDLTAQFKPSWSQAIYDGGVLPSLGIVLSF